MVLVRKLHDRLRIEARPLPFATRAWARYPRFENQRRIQRFLDEGTGRADRPPTGAVYEATMRYLPCEFCYVGDLLNIEAQWREELSVEALSSLEEVWNGERYVEMRRRLLEHKTFPVCRRCCKVEHDPVPAVATADLPKRRAMPMTVVHN